MPSLSKNIMYLMTLDRYAICSRSRAFSDVHYKCVTLSVTMFFSEFSVRCLLSAECVISVFVYVFVLASIYLDHYVQLCQYVRDTDAQMCTVLSLRHACAPQHEQNFRSRFLSVSRRYQICRDSTIDCQLCLRRRLLYSCNDGLCESMAQRNSSRCTSMMFLAWRLCA